jgi:hypothetical protein
MYKRLAIAVFVDACGWDVVSGRPWFMEELSHRQPVRSVFGFSSACVPSILTGRLPNENDHWSSFYYAPDHSPFRMLRHLRWLPSSIVDRGRVRRYLSKKIASAHGFTGYFQVYNLPFNVLPLFDYAERRDIFRAAGINRGTSIFDDLVEMRVPYHASNWRRTEETNLRALQDQVREGLVQFAFLYTAQLDALLHRETKASHRVDEKLVWYQDRFRALLSEARRHYDEVRLAVFSDHGMATVQRVVSLMPRVERLGLTYGTDYAAIYDSTMARFWFLRPGAQEKIRNALQDCADASWVSDAKLKEYGVWWADQRFGHAVYALEPGVLLNPSHMGRVPFAGMHGYRPDHPDSDSSLLTSFAPVTRVEKIPDLYFLMREMVSWAAETNVNRRVEAPAPHRAADRVSD